MCHLEPHPVELADGPIRLHRGRDLPLERFRAAGFVLVLGNLPIEVYWLLTQQEASVYRGNGNNSAHESSDSGILVTAHGGIKVSMAVARAQRNPRLFPSGRHFECISRAPTCGCLGIRAHVDQVQESVGPPFLESDSLIWHYFIWVMSYLSQSQKSMKTTNII